MTKQLLDEEFFWILQAIRHLKQTHPLGELVYFDGNKLKELSPSDQLDLLKILEEKSMIKLSTTKVDSKKENSIFKEKVLVLPCYIETIDSKFDDICIKSERKWKKKIKNIDNIFKDEFDSLSSVEVTLKEVEKFRNRKIDEIIKEKSETKIVKNQKKQYSKIIVNRINYFPESGDAEYKTAIWQFKGKARSFLTKLYENKNMNFSVEEIIKYCNPSLNAYPFKANKDINDTLREIRFRLKVSKGELFPIIKQEKGWIWLEKSS